MNKVVLIGNLTRDPELTTTSNGIDVCRFSLAVQRRYENSEGERDADFINIVVWRGQAENCHKYLKKGSKCCVVGSLQTRTYDAQDGSRRHATEVVAEEVEFLSTKKAEGATEEPKEEKPKSEQTKFEPIDDDNLPF
jgi:single-strand DNA-binding protein